MTPGDIFGAIILLAVLGTLSWAYIRFKERGFRPRAVSTSLNHDQLADAFERTVAGAGWTIIDRGLPIIAQSSFISGIRQQIGLSVTVDEDGCTARIAVLRYSKKTLGEPTKAYTLRWRISAFLREIQRLDAAAVLTG
ncbi:MAG TPA: hypothetical protein VIY28_00380 [Pseudonocardiaceae bacterium]